MSAPKEKPDSGVILRLSHNVKITGREQKPHHSQKRKLSVPVDLLVRPCDSAIGDFTYPDSGITLVELPRADDGAGDVICNDAKGVLLQC